MNTLFCTLWGFFSQYNCLWYLLIKPFKDKWLDEKKILVGRFDVHMTRLNYYLYTLFKTQRQSKQLILVFSIAHLPFVVAQSKLRHDVNNMYRFSFILARGNYRSKHSENLVHLFIYGERQLKIHQEVVREITAILNMERQVNI